MRLIRNLLLTLAIALAFALPAGGTGSGTAEVYVFKLLSEFGLATCTAFAYTDAPTVQGTLYLSAGHCPLQGIVRRMAGAKMVETVALGAIRKSGLDSALGVVLHEDLRPFATLECTVPARGAILTAIGYAHGIGLIRLSGNFTGVDTKDGSYRVRAQPPYASPGMSGGPMLDVRGRVVGILTYGDDADHTVYHGTPVCKATDLFNRIFGGERP